MTSIPIVAYLALFATVGFVFVLVALLLGRVVRSHTPTPQKVETYECGEPSIGPGMVQFDLRFYVVALLFLIFEVEVAMFFPAATVFGKANWLRNPGCAKVDIVHAHAATGSKENGSFLALSPMAEQTYRELGVVRPSLPLDSHNEQPITADDDGVKKYTGAIETEAKTLALTAMLDLGVFFAVLLVGFAYLWRRGDIDWVRAVRHPATAVENAAMMKLRGDQ
jgi:NADH-quinone oxidoreductase subunit A